MNSVWAFGTLLANKRAVVGRPRAVNGCVESGPCNQRSPREFLPNFGLGELCPVCDRLGTDACLAQTMGWEQHRRASDPLFCG